MFNLTNFVFSLEIIMALEIKKKWSFLICTVFNSFIFNTCHQICCHMPDKRFFPHSEQTSDILSTLLSLASSLAVTSQPSYFSHPALLYSCPPGTSLFLSLVLHCLFSGTHVLLFLGLFIHFVGAHLSVTFQERLDGRYILKTLLSLKISLFYFTDV